MREARGGSDTAFTRCTPKNVWVVADPVPKSLVRRPGFYTFISEDRMEQDAVLFNVKGLADE